jgi:hypothetical protein
MHVFLGSERENNSKFIKARCMAELINDEKTKTSDSQSMGYIYLTKESARSSLGFLKCTSLKS